MRHFDCHKIGELYAMKQLILNPVENLPYLISCMEDLQARGLYVSDKEKTEETIMTSKIGFSGRKDYNQKIHQIYKAWSDVLGAQHLSMRLLSGLHAHIIIFMGLGNIGDKILLLPEQAGGHYATKGILERLGYHVIEMAVDNKNYCINIPKTIQIMETEQPDFIFVDRSEGINYEDFGELLKHVNKEVCSVFDASQYLTNIIFHQFTSPFDMGFDIVLSTLHKNFPGPQKALVCSRENSPYWERIQKGMSDYVSSLHVENVLYAGEILRHSNLLKQYSEIMLENSICLERYLHEEKIPVVLKNPNGKPTHHMWINMNSQEKSYSFYKDMETCNILVNYRKLPYNLGYGIRMGTAAATLQGLNPNRCKELARLIAEIYFKGQELTKLKKACEKFIDSLCPLTIERQ